MFGILPLESIGRHVRTAMKIVAAVVLVAGIQALGPVTGSAVQHCYDCVDLNCPSEDYHRAGLVATPGNAGYFVDHADCRLGSFPCGIHDACRSR